MKLRVSTGVTFAASSAMALGALFGCALAGCADDDVLPIVRVDGGADSSVTVDAGSHDAADGAATEDTGTTPADASTDGTVDGASDASSVDSGHDAGVTDAGTSTDANAPDAAKPDAAALTCLPTASVITVANQGASSYLVNGVANAPLTLCRGNAYTFSLTAAGHPFYIKTVQGSGTGNAYSDGVTGNGTEVGLVTFTVPATAPASLFYDCSIHSGMSGPITVIAQ